MRHVFRRKSKLFVSSTGGSFPPPLFYSGIIDFQGRKKDRGKEEAGMDEKVQSETRGM